MEIINKNGIDIFKCRLAVDKTSHPLFKISSLNVIGGGSLNRNLMQFAADECGIPVICGPTEGTALGNALLQIRAAGLVDSLWDMRKISAASVDLKVYERQA